MLLETGLFLWAEVALHPILKVFQAIQLNKCDAGKEKFSSWAHHWHWKPGGFYLQLLCQVSLLRAAFVLLSCSLLPKAPCFCVLQFLLCSRKGWVSQWGDSCLRSGLGRFDALAQDCGLSISCLYRNVPTAVQGSVADISWLWCHHLCRSQSQCDIINNNI